MVYVLRVQIKKGEFRTSWSVERRLRVDCFPALEKRRADGRERMLERIKLYRERF